LFPVLRIRIRDPVLFYPLDPLSGSGMIFSWSRIRIFLTTGAGMTKTESIRSMKKVSLHSTFHVGRIRDTWWKIEKLRWENIRIRDKASWIRSTGFFSLCKVREKCKVTGPWFRPTTRPTIFYTLYFRIRIDLMRIRDPDAGECGSRSTKNVYKF
jgi:hypothetical protein